MKDSSAEELALETFDYSRNKTERNMQRGMIESAMDYYKRGKMRSGSWDGPKVTNPRQAVAIAQSSAASMFGKKKR